MVLCFVLTSWVQFLESGREGGGGGVEGFSPFCDIDIYKRVFCHKFPVFVNLFFAKERIIYLEIHHNCLQYERVLKTFYFHILNVTKFG